MERLFTISMCIAVGSVFLILNLLSLCALLFEGVSGVKDLLYHYRVGCTIYSGEIAEAGIKFALFFLLELAVVAFTVATVCSAF